MELKLIESEQKPSNGFNTRPYTNTINFMADAITNWIDDDDDDEDKEKEEKLLITL